MHYEVRTMVRPYGLQTSYQFDNPTPYDHSKTLSFNTLEDAFQCREVIQRAIWGRLRQDDLKWLEAYHFDLDYPVQIDNNIHEVP